MVQIKLPLVIERQYQIEQRKILNETKRIIEEEIIRYLPQLLEGTGRGDAEHMDDLASKIASLFMIARGKVDAFLALYGVEKTVQGIALLINQFNFKQFSKMVKAEVGVWSLRHSPSISKQAKLNIIRSRAVGLPGPTTAAKMDVFKILQNSIGIDTFADNPKLKETLNVWVVNNVNLIKDVQKKFLDQSEQVIFEGAQKGLRHEVLAKKILAETDLDKGRFKTAKTRANLIARDQVSKLNGTLNRLRQTDVGIKEYEWNGVMDSRERLTHVRSEGHRYSWEEGNPSLGGANPSDEPNCRCWGSPVIDLDSMLGE